MAKKNPTANKQIFSGVSESTKSEAQKKAFAALTSGRNSIELTVAGGEKKLFELVTVPHADIEKSTVVAKENQRQQKLLNEISCGDLLETIEKNGQQYPAIGQYIENDVIETGDGSRRRWTCNHTGKDFLIYATRDGLTRADVKYLSDIGNIRESISLYEKGIEYSYLLEEDVYSSPSELADGEGEDKSIVSIALKAAKEIPEDIVIHIPSINALGRPSIKELLSFLDRVRSSKDKLNKVKEAADGFKLSDQITLLKTRNANRLNKAFLESLYNSVPRKAIKKALPKVAKKGSTVAEITQSTKNSLSLKISSISDEKREQLFAAIKTVIED